MTMKKVLQISIFVLLFVVGSTGIHAQKFGYLNSAALLAEMPEVKQANANLEALQKQLQKKGKGMVETLQAKYAEVEKQVREGRLSPKEQEQEAQKLREEESSIAQFEQDMVKQLKEKEGELLQPVIDRVNEAIQSVAKTNGYQFIFDASPGTGILLYADESQDVSAMVKSELGM
jgi:outer membrane protein